MDDQRVHPFDNHDAGVDQADRDGNQRLAELIRLTQQIAQLQSDAAYLRTHARNLDRELFRLRRDNRATAARMRTSDSGTNEAAYWKARYEAVVSSLSWRIVWWLASPYRLLTRRRSAPGS
jgi:cell division protein FtsB